MPERQSHSAPSAPRARTGLLLATVSAAGGSYSLLQSLVAPALPDIQRDLGVSTTAVAWIFTAYLLSASIATPIAGRLGDMFGKKRILVLAVAALALGSLVAALSSSLAPLIAGRAIQGLGGAVFPLSYGIIRDEFPRHKVAGGIAFTSAILGVGGGLGIILSGPILSVLSYHWLFWFPFFVICLILVAVIVVVPESRLRTPGKVNWAGAALLSGWLICLLLGVSEGRSWGWGSPKTLALLVAAALLAATWMRVEERSPVPLVDMQMLRRRGVWTTNLATLLIGFGMFASFILVPQFVELPQSTGYGFGASVTAAGLFLVPATIAMLIVSPLTGRITNAVGSKVPLVAGAAVSAVAFALMAFVHGQEWQIYLATALMGIGIGLAFASMTNLIVEAVPREQTGVASGMNAIMRSIGSSLGSQVSATIIAASILASGLPGERGFTIAFAMCAGVLVVGTLAAAAVPSRAARAHAGAAADAAVANASHSQ